MCQTEVAADDPAFADPTKFVGPVYTEEVARGLAAAAGLDGPARTATAGGAWSPRPSPGGSSSSPPIERLVGAGALVICTGGGGVPVFRDADGRLRGAEAVIDKDLAAALWPSTSAPTP